MSADMEEQAMAGGQAADSELEQRARALLLGSTDNLSGMVRSRPHPSTPRGACRASRASALSFAALAAGRCRGCGRAGTARGLRAAWDFPER